MSALDSTARSSGALELCFGPLRVEVTCRIGDFAPLVGTALVYTQADERSRDSNSQGIRKNAPVFRTTDTRCCDN
jgi:hypothetical protein